MRKEKREDPLKKQYRNPLKIKFPVFFNSLQPSKLNLGTYNWTDKYMLFLDFGNSIGKFPSVGGSDHSNSGLCFVRTEWQVYRNT